jgi:hypothetical protein
LNTLLPGVVLVLSSTDARVESLKASAAADPAAATGALDAECVRYEALKEAAAAVMGAVTTDGVHSLVGELGRQMEHEGSPKRRRWGCWLAGQFFTHSQASFGEYVPVLLKFLLSRVAETDRALLQVRLLSTTICSLIFPCTSTICIVENFNLLNACIALLCGNMHSDAIIALFCAFRL